MDFIIGHFYDSIVYFGNVVAQLVAKGQDPTDAKAIQKLIGANFTFESPINGKIYLDPNSDRMFSFIIRSFSIRTSSYEVHVHIKEYSASEALLQWSK